MRKYCKEHRKEINKCHREYYKKHPEKCKAYYAKNSGKIKARSKAYRESNQEHVKEYMAKYWRANKRKIKKYIESYWKKHNKKSKRKEYDQRYAGKMGVAQMSAFARAYRERHPSRVRKQRKKYSKSLRGIAVRKACKQRRLAGEIGLTAETVQRVYEDNIKKYGTLTCVLCFTQIKFGQDDLEHDVPVSRRAEFPEVDVNAYENLGVAHGAASKENCNGKKHTMTCDEWFARNKVYKARKRNIVNQQE
jgi:hypothetical protein